MKLSDIARNVDQIEAGVWVKDIPSVGDLSLKVRGKDNADWRRMESQLIAAVPRGKRVNGRIAPEEVDRITSTLLLDACLIDWRNLEDKPYSKDLAATLLTDPQYRAFRDACLWAATLVADGQAAAAEDVAKN